MIGTTFEKDTGFEGCEFDVGDEQTFRKLKLQMEKQGHHWQAVLFHGRELEEERMRFWAQFKRNRSLEVILELLLNGLFLVLNDYGRKWWRPLGWLIASTVVFGLGFLALDSFDVTTSRDLEGWEMEMPNGSRWFQAFMFSLQNLRLSWLFGRQVFVPTSGWAWFLAGFQSVTSIVLIAMLVLSIRRRFKLQ
jgi:hypothetical protein